MEWHVAGDRGVYASYHWLDQLGNPIVWGGIFSHLAEPVPPGTSAEIAVDVDAPMPPGRYRLAIDLVAEARCWFAEVGNEPLGIDCDVLPRLVERTLAVQVRPGLARLEAETQAALAALEEPVVTGDEAAAVAHLVAGCLPAADWSRRILDAHAEGYGVVGGSVEPVGAWRLRRRLRAELEPWAPGTGRNPAFAQPLVCPSVVAGVEPSWVQDVGGLPALEPVSPSLYDGRIVMRFRVA